MPSANLNIGDYSVQSLGTINIQSTGPQINVEAGGLDSALVMSGQIAATMQSGPAILSLTNEADVVGSASLQAGELGNVKLGVGLPEIGAFVTLEPELITLSVGAPGVGACIKMTPESITFSVGEVMYTMTPAGIVEDVAECSRELTAEGHNLTAAETEFNVGVQGESKELPTADAEIEGGSAINQTLGDLTTDAALNADSAITMMV